MEAVLPEVEQSGMAPQPSSSRDSRGSTCPLCMDHYREIEDHMRAHMAGLPFKCGVCGCSYKTRTGLAAHMHKHSKSNIRRQSAVVIGVKPLSNTELRLEMSCNGCHKIFHSKSLLQQHQRMCSSNSGHGQRSMAASTNTTEVTPSHTTTMEAISSRVPTAKPCLNVSPTKQKQSMDTGRASEWSQINRDKGNCPVCNLSYYRGPSFVRHVEAHFANGAYQCMFCSISYDDLGQVTKHHRHKHQDKKMMHLNTMLTKAQALDIGHRQFQKPYHEQREPASQSTQVSQPNAVKDSPQPNSTSSSATPQYDSSAFGTTGLDSGAFATPECNFSPLETTKFDSNAHHATAEFDSSALARLESDYSAIASSEVDSAAMAQSDSSSFKFVFFYPHNCGHCGAKFKEQSELDKHQATMHSANKEEWWNNVCVSMIQPSQGDEKSPSCPFVSHPVICISSDEED